MNNLNVLGFGKGSLFFVSVVGFYLLLFLLFFGIPFAIGFCLSMILREMGPYPLAEEKKGDQATQAEEEAVSQKLYDPSLDEDSSAAIENEAEAAQEEISATETVPPAADEEKPTPPEQQVQSPLSNIPDDSEEEQAADLKSVFKNQHETSHEIPLDMLKIGDVLDNIVNNEALPEVPPDIVSQLEKEQTPEELLKQYNETGESAEPDVEDAEEDEILAKSMNSEEKPEIDFPNEQNAGSFHPDISPQAAGLLGKDFDFDSLLNQEPKTEPDTKETAEQETAVQNTEKQAVEQTATISSEQSIVEQSVEPLPEQSMSEQPVEQMIEQKIEQEISIHELGLGIYQTDGGIITAGSALPEQLSGKQDIDIVSSFPAHFIQDTVIEPDEVAGKYNFTTESQPMFVRNKKKTKK